MKAAPIRFLNATLWPLTIWLSLTHLEEHPADDYVERTSPIVATAIAFWLCLAGLAAAAWIGAGPTAVSDGAQQWAEREIWTGQIVSVLGFFTPAIYVVGFWLFTARDEAFRR